MFAGCRGSITGRVCLEVETASEGHADGQGRSGRRRIHRKIGENSVGR